MIQVQIWCVVVACWSNWTWSSESMAPFGDCRHKCFMFCIVPVVQFSSNSNAETYYSIYKLMIWTSCDIWFETDMAGQQICISWNDVALHVRRRSELCTFISFHLTYIALNWYTTSEKRPINNNKIIKESLCCCSGWRAVQACSSVYIELYSLSWSKKTIALKSELRQSHRIDTYHTSEKLTKRRGRGL